MHFDRDKVMGGDDPRHSRALYQFADGSDLFGEGWIVL